jgi:hypothetical protein
MSSQGKNSDVSGLQIKFRKENAKRLKNCRKLSVTSFCKDSERKPKGEPEIDALVSFNGW